MTMKTAHLLDRALVRIDGEGAGEFLQNLITCDVETLAPGEAGFGALLTPQGKILFDFFCLPGKSGFLIDIDRGQAVDFVKRLMFYRLRLALEIALVDDSTKIFSCWDSTDTAFEGAFGDPRLAAMGSRVFATDLPANADIADYHRHRIAIGMPQGGIDYNFGEAFPHDAMMDQFSQKSAGVSFAKGCFIGQEVVSRMQHRGTARRRIVMISAISDLPTAGSDIEVDGRSIGRITSLSGKNGLAMVRIDRLEKAITAGQAIITDGIELRATLPEWTYISLAVAEA